MRPLGRLGLNDLAADHWNSLVVVGRDDEVRTSKTDLVLFYAVPLGAGVLVWSLGAELRALSQLLAGVAIITGLLFGLLTHVLSLGLRLHDDARISASSRVAILTDELRANVSYAIALGVVLTSSLMLVGAFSPDREPGEGGGHPAWLSALILTLVLHLMLTLLMILKRVRTTYRLLAK